MDILPVRSRHLRECDIGVYMSATYTGIYVRPIRISTCVRSGYLADCPLRDWGINLGVSLVPSARCFFGSAAENGKEDLTEGGIKNET